MQVAILSPAGPTITQLKKLRKSLGMLWENDTIQKELD
jgi:hypothetical protein